MTEIANPERGEVEVTLDGVAYPMRPSWEAQQAIERQTGVGMDEFYVRAMRLAQGLTGGAVVGNVGFKLDELVTIVIEGVKAARKDRGEKPLADWKPDRVAELIVNHRMRVVDAVGEFVLNACTGGSEKKAEATPENG